MPYFLHTGSVLYSSLNYVPMTSLGPPMNGIHFQGVQMLANYQVFFPKNMSRAFDFTHAFSNKHFGRTLQLSTDEELFEPGDPHLCIRSSPDQISVEEVQVDNSEEQLLSALKGCVHDGADTPLRLTKKRMIKDDVEIQRRRKIGLANKGKAPWNKGRKHSPETRERIKKRTIEALRDPKVRKKMSESSCSHSYQSKARIGFALRRIWGERLKHKRLQEKCYLTWAGSVAEAARKGGRDQQELEWDSFEKIKADILLQHLQWKADKAREREIAKRRAERAAKAKAEKMARLAQQIKEREQKTRVNKSKKKAPKKSEDKRKELAISKDLKLRARLTKIHRKKQLAGLVFSHEIGVGVQPNTEEWDLEFIEREKSRRRIPLADQIVAAKNKKAECSAKDVLITIPSFSSLSEEEEEENGFI